MLPALLRKMVVFVLALFDTVDVTEVVNCGIIRDAMLCGCRTGHGQSPWANFGPARSSSSKVDNGVASMMRTGQRNRGRNGRKSSRTQ